MVDLEMSNGARKTNLASAILGHTIGTTIGKRVVTFGVVLVRQHMSSQIAVPSKRQQHVAIRMTMASNL